MEDQPVSVPSIDAVSTSANDQETSVSNFRQERSVSKVNTAEEISSNTSKESSDDEDTNPDAE